MYVYLLYAAIASHAITRMGAFSDLAEHVRKLYALSAYARQRWIFPFLYILLFIYVYYNHIA